MLLERFTLESSDRASATVMGETGTCDRRSRALLVPYSVTLVKVFLSLAITKLVDSRISLPLVFFWQVKIGEVLEEVEDEEKTNETAEEEW